MRPPESADPETAPIPVDPAIAEPVPPADVDDAEPEPEPMTPARVLAVNRYYDLYVASSVLILIFVAATHRVINSLLWVHLQTGRLMVEKGGPILSDPYSFTIGGRPWANVSWLYDLMMYGLYQAGLAFSAGAGIPTLVVANSLVVVATGLILMAIRRPGPGLWWSAVCTLTALGVMIIPSKGIVAAPLVVGLGGISGRAVVEPDTWAALLMAGLIWLLDRGTTRRGPLDRGRPRLLVAVPAVLLLWANLSETFVVGQLVAIAWLVVAAIRPARGVDGGPGRLSPRDASILVVACLAVGAATPSFLGAYAAAWSPFRDRLAGSGLRLEDQLSFFGSASLDYLRNQHGGSGRAALAYPAYYLAIVALGLTSFALNRRRASAPLLAAFVVASAAWGLLMRFSVLAAPVIAASLAINGQEWYLGRYGAEGRMGRAWSAWSVGGRAVTLLVVVAALLRGLTGFGASSYDLPFAFGYNEDDFAFEAAKAVLDPKITGNVLNVGLRQGDALIWRAYPDRKCFIDERRGTYPPELLETRIRLLAALRDGEKAVWVPILDESKVSVVMLSPLTEPRTYRNLSTSSDWILFHDDGNSALFGRADASPGEVAYFKESRLDAGQMVYRRPAIVPANDRPPTPTTWIDAYFKSRLQVPTQPHDFAASRWLQLGAGPGGNLIPESAYCIAAIREARTALSKNADDNDAYRLLARTYGFLGAREAEILARAGRAPTTPPLRSRQRAAALFYAIQTTPPPGSLDARVDLALLNLELAALYRSIEAVDLERDRLQAARDLVSDAYFTLNDRDRLVGLDRGIDEVQARIAEQAAAQQANPAQRAELALSVGLVGQAIREFEEADRISGGGGNIKWRLVDLYCRTGQPDQAITFLGNTTSRDPSADATPGSSLYRQGLVYLLMGNYAFTAQTWEQALTDIRSSQVSQAIEGFRSILLGTPRGVVAFEELPGRVNSQATWEFELGLCLLEGGSPEVAATHLAKAVELAPNIPARPIIAYYLEKLGKPLPASIPPVSSEGAPSPAPTPGA